MLVLSELVRLLPIWAPLKTVCLGPQYNFHCRKTVRLGTAHLSDSGVRGHGNHEEASTKKYKTERFLIEVPKRAKIKR